jgi:hypothetical protein
LKPRSIESLSDNILKIMRKGATVLTNINLLKWCCHYGIDVNRNMLLLFPGETDEDYRSQTALFPLLTHLPPPGSCENIWFERFSPYFFDAEIAFPDPSADSWDPPRAAPEGWRSAAFEFCADRPHSLTAVVTHLHDKGCGALTAVTRFLDRCVEQGIVIGSAGLYLSLALPMNVKGHGWNQCEGT